MIRVLISWCDECLQGNGLHALGGAREVGRNGKLNGFVAVIIIVSVVRILHGVPLFDNSVGLHHTETTLIKKYKTILCNSPLLRSEKIKYIVRLQQLMHGKIHRTYKYTYIDKIDVQENTWYI